MVGDDDQSIYRFRGATIENILSFEGQYKGCRVIRLEQNYRSTTNILAAANAVIKHNQGRKGKELWTAGAEGDKVSLYTAMNEHDEAQYVATQILENYGQGRKWKDHAILYRMNAQSNQMENACKRNGEGQDTLYFPFSRWSRRRVPSGTPPTAFLAPNINRPPFPAHPRRQRNLRLQPPPRERDFRRATERQRLCRQTYATPPVSVYGEIFSSVLAFSSEMSYTVKNT